MGDSQPLCVTSALALPRGASRERRTKADGGQPRREEEKEHPEAQGSFDDVNHDPCPHEVVWRVSIDAVNSHPGERFVIVGLQVKWIGGAGGVIFMLI